MSEAKPILFLSHIGEEKELAIEIKQLFDESFLGMMEVFVSSDDATIPLGQKWLDRVTEALESCAVEVILCSPQSVRRPWINFEAGAGWIRKIPVIPLCHSGMEPSNLPTPLNLLQAAKANEVSSLKLVLPVLATALGARVPSPDLNAVVSKVQEFEARYMFWDYCNFAFRQIHLIDPNIIEELRQGRSVDLDLPEAEIQQISELASSLANQGILSFYRFGRMIVASNGTYYGCRFEPLGRLAEIFADSKFEFNN